MAHIEYHGQKVPILDDWRVGELIEAENALDLNMEKAKGGAKFALTIYMSIRRVDKDTPAGVLADTVMKMEFSEFLANLAKDAEDDAGPPAVGATDVNGHASETDAPLTTGRPLSGASA